MPDSVIKILIWAFGTCENLEEIIFSKNLRKIERNAFRFCKKLKKIILPFLLKGLEPSTFENCENLEEIYISGNVKYIGAFCFLGCKKLKEITFSKNVESVGDYIFTNCENLEKIIILNKDVAFGKKAFNMFEDCTKENLEKCHATLYGFKGSTTEKYANEHGLDFKEILIDKIDEQNLKNLILEINLPEK